ALGDAALAARAKTVEEGPADVGAGRAERDRAHHVLAATNAAVHVDLDVAADRVEDGRERRDRRGRAVELASAVVRDDDRVGPGARGDPGVLGIEDALEDQLAAPALANPLDVGPGERGIELARG